MSDVPGASGHRALGGLHLVLVGLALWNIGNYAYFTIAERVSGPRDYATVGALLAVAMLVQIPAGAVQVGVARLIPTFPDRSPEAAWLMRHAVARCVAGGAVAAVVVGVVARLAAPGLSWAEVVWTAVAVLPIPVFSLGTGILQGQQRFGAFAGAVSLLGVPRPLALLALLPAFAAVTSAVAGSAAAMLVAGGAAVALAWPRGVPSPLDPPRHLWRRFLRTLGPLALGLTGVGTLLNLDYIVARATLPAHTAGLFAGVAVLAKATVIIPQAVAWVLQPRVATLEHEGHSASRLLGLGVSITIVTVAVTAGLTALVGRPLVELLFGHKFGDGAVYLAPVIATTGLTGLLLLMMNHQLARGVDGFAWVVAALGAVEAVLFAVFHRSVAQLLVVETAVGCAGLVVYELRYGRSDAGLSRSMRAMLRPAQPRTGAA